MERPRSAPAAALATLAMLLLATGCGGGNSGKSEATSAAVARREQVAGAARKAGLPGDVADFLGQSATVVGSRFRVTYDLGDGGGGTADLMQDPPLRRVDLRTQVQGKEVTRALISGGKNGSVACQRSGGSWVCQPAAGADASFGGFGEKEVAAAVEDLRKSKNDYDFRLAEREVAGVKARCLVTELKPGHKESPSTGRKGTLCISPEGVPLLVETPSASLRALRYSTNVDDKVFEPPAEVKRP